MKEDYFDIEQPSKRQKPLPKIKTAPSKRRRFFFFLTLPGVGFLLVIGILAGMLHSATRDLQATSLEKTIAPDRSGHDLRVYRIKISPQEDVIKPALAVQAAPQIRSSSLEFKAGSSNMVREKISEDRCLMADPSSRIAPSAAFERAESKKPQAGSSLKIEETIGPEPAALKITKLVRAGKIELATELSRTHHGKHPAVYSICLEVDCRQDSVTRAFRAADFDSRMFILPRKVKERHCYGVLWGTYQTRREARQQMKHLPSFFNRQRPSPRVVYLKPYLAAAGS